MTSVFSNLFPDLAVNWKIVKLQTIRCRFLEMYTIFKFNLKFVGNFMHFVRKSGNTSSKSPVRNFGWIVKSIFVFSLENSEKSFSGRWVF